MSSLPIDTILPKLKEAVRTHPSVVLHAPPGAGKTTRVPLALLEILPPGHGRVIMLEPRRIAAISAARWMAQTLGEQAGETIGYAIRFDAKSSAKTRIEVVTEGILTRRIQSDPALEGVSMVIFDEFHERSIHADLALALCLDVQKGLRQDLKILIMSATMESGPIASLLGNAPVITSSGRSFPVEERYLEEGGTTLPGRIASAVRTALNESSGDLLVFLPGAGEIRACAQQLNSSFGMNDDRVSVHSLYGDLPFEEQERALLPSVDHRKIVLATNIAETSLTIEGVRTVIDSGMTRTLRYDPATGMNRLMTVPVSKASAEQRKGRAGRLGPGICYRLYSRHVYQGLTPFTQPEIMSSDLAPLALDLAAWGVKDPCSLSWLDAPPAAAWEVGVRILQDLGALDPAGSVTPIGRDMARFPLPPRLSRLLVKAGEQGRQRLGADLAALLSERDVLRRGMEEHRPIEPDISERITLLSRWRTGSGSGGSMPGYADPHALKAVDRVSRQLLRLMQGVAVATGESADGDALAGLLLAAYPDRVCKKRDEAGGRFVMAQGRGVRLSKDSPLGSSPYLIALQVDAGEKTEGTIYIAAQVSEDRIRKDLRDRIRTVRKVEWDRKENRIAAAREERLETLVLSRRTFIPSDEEAAPILCDMLRTDPGLLVFSKEARQFQGRVALLKRAFPEEAWPDLADDVLLSRPEDWLLSWLGNVRSAQALSGLNLLPALKARLTWEQGRLLDERAPAALRVPSNSMIPLDYASGELPVLAVKLQELFGLADTPRIAGGRVRVLLHLLSPARRPVQITQDLKGFWNTGYPLVKKDLKGRYPKHPWPDDPWNAAPTRRTKPRPD